MNLEGLPKLPGLDFENRLKQRHHVPHSFDSVNGYRIPRNPTVGIGGDPLKENSISFVSKKTTDPILLDPLLTYGRVKKPHVEPFRPHFVRYDKKTLRFKGYFRQQVPESQVEHFRTRFVDIFYFLEDDTILVNEPVIDNCGFPQGKLVRRGKVVKNSTGAYYTWKDFNIGIDMDMQGIVFHIGDCDPFTKEFLLSNGIELNPVECLPIDPVGTDRMIQRIRFPPTKKKPSTAPADDKLRRYLEYQGMVLHFDCVLDERDQPGGELMTYKLFYYLEDDTVAIKELKENREGRYHFPMMMKRTMLPKNTQELPSSFPSIYLEPTTAEVTEYYSPKDLKVGETIIVYGRKFLLLDCDKFTRDYYERVLREPQPERMSIPRPEKKKPKRPMPDYLGLGTPEDSLASCYGLIPKSPKKDIVNYLVNSNKYLRYGCVLDTKHPEDMGRKFMLLYSLADHTIQIVELAQDNSGIQGGRFLSSRKVPKPNCDPNDPIYYTAKDFYIDALLHIYSHRFKIVSADLYCYRYMQNYPEQFTPEAVESVRRYLLLQGHLQPDLSEAIEKEVIEQKLTTPINDEPKDMEEYLKQLKVTDEPQSLPLGEKEREQLRRPSPNEDRGDCPYYIIPEDAKREGYHESKSKEYLEDKNKRPGSVKSVHFNDDVLTQC